MIKYLDALGKLMEEILAWREDEWEPALRRMGFYLGKFIYLMDAYDDVEKDLEKGNYNPFAQDYIMEGFQERVCQILIMMMAEACRELRNFRIIKYADICEIFCTPAYGAGLRQFQSKGRRNRRKNMFDPYSILGVSRDASDEEIKKAIQKAQPEVSSGCKYQ